MSSMFFSKQIRTRFKMDKSDFLSFILLIWPCVKPENSIIVLNLSDSGEIYSSSLLVSSGEISLFSSFWLYILGWNKKESSKISVMSHLFTASVAHESVCNAIIKIGEFLCLLDSYCKIDRASLGLNELEVILS